MCHLVSQLSLHFGYPVLVGLPHMYWLQTVNMKFLVLCMQTVHFCPSELLNDEDNISLKGSVSKFRNLVIIPDFWQYWFSNFSKICEKFCYIMLFLTFLCKKCLTVFNTVETFLHKMCQNWNIMLAK